MENIISLSMIALVSFGLSYVGSSVGLMLGHLRLPLLVHWVGSTVAGAGTNLAISAVGAASGFYEYARRKQVDYRLVLVIGVPSAAASFLIAKFISHHATASVDTGVRMGTPLGLRFLMGLILAGSGVELIFRQKKENSVQSNIVLPKHSLLIESAIGVVFGALAGAVGLMMGGARLCSIIRILRLDPKTAIGTNLAVGGLTGILGALGAWSGADFNNPVFLSAGIATVLGARYGARATAKFSPVLVSKCAGLAIALSAVYMVSHA